jgi:hypothetical protein
MAVYWLVYKTRKGAEVVLVESSALIHARLAAELAGLGEGEFTEGHELPEHAKAPKGALRKRLSTAKAAALIRQWERGRP